MYRYFKDIAEKSSCSLSGVCTIHPSISAMDEVLLSIIREISFYVVKMKEFGLINKKLMAQSIDALGEFLINTSINQNKYLELISELNLSKKEIKEKYTNYCRERKLPYEIIDSTIEIEKNTSVAQLINFAEASSLNKQKISDKTKQSLFELIVIFSKISAINVGKIKRFKQDFDEYDYEILRFFALTNGYSIRNEKIIRRIKEFSNIAFDIKNELFKVLKSRYGKKESSIITTDEHKGHCILVSGDDLIELENVLKMLENSEIEEEINVYTNGNMFLAHFYPFFKNNKFLKGHWGGDDTQYDFSTFPGAILITRNFIHKIDSLYKGAIFSNKLISFSKVTDIKGNDYMPLIQSALEQNGFTKDSKNLSYNISYDLDLINDTINSLSEKEIVIIAGNMDNDNILDEYKNKKIINLNCPLETDILLDCVKILKEKNVKITVFFPQCNLENLNTLFSFLGSDIDLYMSNCSNTLINPHVTEALCKNFKVKII